MSVSPTYRLQPLDRVLLDGRSMRDPVRIDGVGAA